MGVCGKLNNLLCQFWKCDPFVKQLKLLRNFCCDFYGSCLWDLSHSSIEDLNIAWRKDLRRLLGLPYRTHSIMLSPLCGTLPFEYELVCRSANFMNNCMNSCNAVSSRGGECTSLLGPGEPYTPNSEEDTNCLGPVEPHAPPTSKYGHIGKKQESPWDGQPPSPARALLLEIPIG